MLSFLLISQFLISFSSLILSHLSSCVTCSSVINQSIICYWKVSVMEQISYIKVYFVVSFQLVVSVSIYLSGSLSLFPFHSHPPTPHFFLFHLSFPLLITFSPPLLISPLTWLKIYTCIYNTHVTCTYHTIGEAFRDSKGS